MHLYDHPKYYDVAFSFRDIEKEAAFLHACIQRFADIPVSRILEIACGHGPHIGELARLGYHYTGLDNNSNMLEYARNKWNGTKPAPEFTKQDMLNFECANPVDFAFVMLGSLYLNSRSQIDSHLDSVARALNPGGLYFLDWCIQFSDPLQYDTDNKFALEKDGIVIESEFDITLFDEKQNLYEEVWNVNVDDQGERHAFRSKEINKAILPDEFLEILAERQDLTFVGWWQDWDFAKPIVADDKPDRPIALIRRTV